MEKLVLDRVSCHVTSKCNLRCNKCSAYIPELYALPSIPMYTLEQMKNSFKVYFEMVESVRMISLSGGEPFLFSELDKLVDFLLTYEDRFKKLEIFTNGTLPVSDNLLNSSVKNEKISFLIDNYGPAVSKKVDAVEEALKNAGISFKTRKYYGSDVHMNGWHDYGISSEKKANAAEAKFRYEKCYGGVNGNMLCTIFGTRLFLCPLAEVGRRIGRIPLNDTLFIDLSEEKTSIEEKLDRFRSMLAVDYNPACAYCNGSGVYDNEPRYTPGEQLTQVKGAPHD
ncbi:MAG: radical protein [Firmicutes bacterium]|nr:radical protein [Bacillota bacterium]